MDSFYNVDMLKGSVYADVHKSEIEDMIHRKNNILGNKLFFAKLRSSAIIPTKNDEDAGYDIYANFTAEYVSIEPHSTLTIPTGIATAMSDDYYLQIEERGSTGTIGMKYGSGVIDSSYRGEIFIPITNTNNHRIIIYKGERDAFIKNYKIPVNDILYPYKKAICQAIVHIVPKMIPIEISYEKLLSIPSSRGKGSLGSSGK